MSQEDPAPAEEQTEEATPEVETKSAKKRKASKKGAGVLARLTQYEIEERRGHVEKLRTYGLGFRQIAQTLGVSLDTVDRDMEAIQSANAKRISQFEKDKHLGNSLARYAQLRQEAWTRYTNAKEERHKLKALEVLLAIEKEETGMLRDTGVIVKPKEEPAQIEHKHTLALDWSAEMQEKVANSLLQLSLSSNLAEPTPEGLPPIRQDEGVIDVTETVDSETEETTACPEEEVTSGQR